MCEKMSAGDPSGTQHACRESAAEEEAEAECEPAGVPEHCCSGWPSSASGAGSTAPESEVEASGSRSPGCSAPVGQNHAWCSPSDFGQKISRVRILQEYIQMDMITLCGKKTQP